MVYNQCSCPLTCEDTTCNSVNCLPGCECPNQEYDDGTKCVPMTDCYCIINGTRREVVTNKLSSIKYIILLIGRILILYYDFRKNYLLGNFYYKVELNFIRPNWAKITSQLKPLT